MNSIERTSPLLCTQLGEDMPLWQLLPGDLLGYFFIDKSSFGALQKNHTHVIISPLSFNMSCRGLTCNPGKVFYDNRNNDQCSSVTRKWLQEIKHWIRNHLFLFFSEPPLVINAVLGIIKLDTLVQVFQLVAPLLSWNGRKTNFSQFRNFSSLKIEKGENQ